MPLDGKYIGRYQLLHVIGQGSMGEVYLAKDSKLNRQVAIKIAHAGANTYATPIAIQEASRLFLRRQKL